MRAYRLSVPRGTLLYGARADRLALGLRCLLDVRSLERVIAYAYRLRGSEFWPTFYWFDSSCLLVRLLVEVVPECLEWYTSLIFR